MNSGRSTGSLATTHESQGSDMGLFGGLLGWEADDERLPDSAQALRAAGISLEVRLAELGPTPTAPASVGSSASTCSWGLMGSP